MANFIDKIGLDRVAHFGVGGTLFAAFNVMFALSLIDTPAVALSWWTVLVLPLAGYIAVAFAEAVKEYFIDGKPDGWDIVATFAGAVFVHICAIIGWGMHWANGRDLISSAWGWAIFGIVIAALAGAFARWCRKELKK